MAGRPRQEDEPQADPGAGWPVVVADMISKVSGRICWTNGDCCSLLSSGVRLLLADKLVARFRTHAYCAMCLLPEFARLQSPAHPTMSMFEIPHPLRDSVLSAAKERFERFVRQTFWCNEDFYACCLAAQALAKRGGNVDRCFIGVSAGGTGQSLYSSHLAAIYRHNHAFIDPNLWHNEDDLRKQLESFAGAFIITAQEKPESHKTFREDLYKK